MKIMQMLNRVTSSLADTSMNGRKFRLFIVGLGVGAMAFLSTCICPDLGPNLGLLFTFIGGMYMTFCGSNVAATWAMGSPKTDPAPVVEEESSQDGVQ